MYFTQYQELGENKHLLSQLSHTVCSRCTAVGTGIAGVWGQGGGRGGGRGGDREGTGRGIGREAGRKAGRGMGRGQGRGREGTGENVGFSSRVFSNDILSHQHREELLF